MSFFIISSVLTAGNGGQLGGETSPASDVLTLFRFVKIEEICDRLVIENYQVYFDQWIGEHLKMTHDIPTPNLFEDLNKSFEDHHEAIKNYLESFLLKRKTVTKYATAFMEIEVEDLLKKIGSVLKDDYVPEFQSLKEPVEISDNLKDFIQTVQNTQLEPNMIGKVADLFKPIYEKVKENPENFADYQTIMPVLVDNIKDKLIEVLKTYLNVPTNELHDSLSEDDKLNVTAFYEKFKFLLNEPELRSEILRIITSQQEEPVKDPKFFKEDLFKHLENKSKAFRPIFVRDRFITIPTSDPTLDKMHDAAENFQFSPELFNAIDADFDDVEFDKPKDERKKGPEAEAKRGNAKLELMLYQTYAMARKDGTISHDHDNSKDKILDILFKWIVNTDAFDIEKLADKPDQEDNIFPVHEELQLIPAEKFQTYFVPLLNLICKKLDQLDKCELFNSNSDKIAQKFKKFDNVLLFKNNALMMKLVPTEILEALNAKATELHFDDFVNAVQETVTYAPQVYKRVVKGKSRPVYASRPERLEKEQDLQDKFEKDIANKYLPNEIENDPVRVKYLESFLAKVGSSANEDKGNVMEDLLVNYIAKKVKEGKINVEKSDLLRITSTRLVDKLRSHYDFKELGGMRNFLMYHLNTFHFPKLEQDLNGNDIPLPEPLNSIYLLKTYDLVFFINIATEEYLRALKSDKNSESKTEFALYSTKHQIYRKNLSAKGMLVKIESFKKNVWASSTVIERINSFIFFTHFIDFFDYFEKYEESNATFGDYQQAYVNFYDFLILLRMRIDKDELNPHNIALESLYSCLKYTSEVEHSTSDSDLHDLCIFSHRKYAEILFFYKLYLLSSEKPGKFDLSPYTGSDFNTHVRLFFTFLHQNKNYKIEFERQCEKSNEAICASWKMFSIIIDQLINPKIAKLTFGASVFTSLDRTDFVDKMKAVNAFEAASLVVTKGNIIDYEKLINGINFEIEGQALTFSEIEADQLAIYLKRTYRKAIYSDLERPISHLIQTILSDEINEIAAQDTLESFLLYNNNIHIDYLKVFLLFANTDKEYRRIAEVLIKKKIDVTKLALLNSPDHDQFISQLISYIKGMFSADKPIEQSFSAFRKALQEKYAQLSKVCIEASYNELAMEALNKSELDMYAGFLGDFEDEEQEIAAEEEEQFQSIILQNLKVVEVQNDYQNFHLEDDHQYDMYEQMLDGSDSKRTGHLSPKKFNPNERVTSEELDTQFQREMILNGVPLEISQEVKEIFKQNTVKIANAKLQAGNKIVSMSSVDDELSPNDSKRRFTRTSQKKLV